MVDPALFWAFVPAALLLNLTPGADMMFCLGQGLRSSKWAAVAASAGIMLGGMVHVILAGLGLSSLIAAHPQALEVIRWIGVGYLLWLAWHSWRSGSGPKDSIAPDAGTLPKPARALGVTRAFWQGFMVNLSNPKVILFVLAFVPQFVDASRGAVLGQFLIFGAVIGLGGFIINAVVGVLAGAMSLKLGRNGRAARILARLSAIIFVGLALRLIRSETGVAS